MKSRAKSEPKGIIFDCDGTLADTMPLHWRAWQAIARRHRLHFPEDRFYSLGGVPSRDILKMLGQEQGVTLDHLAIAHEKEAEFLPLLAQVEPVNTVVGVARAYHGKIPLAVASGGTQHIIGQVLRHLNIHHLFDAIVTSEDVTRQKPRRIFFSKPHGASVCPRNSAALTKIRIWEFKPSLPPAWKPSTSANWICRRAGNWLASLGF